MKKFLLISLTLILSAISIFAQATTGRIIGTVSTSDGAVAGATVTITDSQTGKVRTVTTSDDGTFEVAQLSFGTYSVKITANGFKTFVSPDVKIDAGREFPLNAVLEIGQITEEVTVTAGAENINSTTGELATTVSAQQIRELPLNSRNPLALLNLQAGVNATSSSINGQRTSSVNYTRDGVNVQDNFIRNGFVSDAPTVDNTGEFNVVTQNAGSELGSGSTQVQLVTPRGGKAFHGSLYEFNRNSKFTAKSFFANLNKLNKPFLNRNQFGGSISGPLVTPNFGEGGPVVRKDKAFFFFNYEGFLLAQQVAASATTLLGTAQDGTFSYTGTDNVTRTVNVLTGAGLTGAIPAASGGVLTVDPIIRARLLDKLPKTGNGVLTGVNYLQTVNFNRADPETRKAATTRVDFEINDRSSVNFVYKWNTITDARTDQFAGFSPTVFVNQGGPTNLYSGAWNWSPKNDFTNEVRIGFQRSKPFFSETGTPVPTNFLIAGLPFTTPEPTFRSQGRNTDYWTIQDNAVYTFGSHSLRFGFNLQKYKIESLNYAGTTPTYNISTTGNSQTPALTTALFTSISTTDLARANALRYALAGIIGSASQSVYYQGAAGYVIGAPSKRQFTFDNYAGYLSDQWRVRPNLTLNLGARYEVYTPLHDPLLINLEPKVTNPKDIVASLISEDVLMQVVGGNAGKPGDYFKTDWNNIGPNVSFAYSPRFENGFLSKFSKDTVIRGGFRVNYVNDEYVRSTDNAAQNNAGLGTVGVNALRAGTTSTLLKSSLSNIAPFNVGFAFQTPVVTTFPIKLQDRATSFTETISLIDPKLQVQNNLEFNLGIQRNIGFNSVLEVRYVGGLSNQLTRSIDYGQVDVRGSGYLADFVKAQQNCRLQATAPTGVGGAGVNPASVYDPIFSCTNASYNPAIPGSQPLTILNQISNLNTAAILDFIKTGQVGELAFQDIGTGRVGYVENAIRNSLLANSAAGVANLTTNGGKYRYNSVQVEFRRRFSQGFSYQANYTFQKILADVVDDGQTRVNPYLDNLNPKLDYARPDYDRTHTVNANFIYELPFGKGKQFLNEGGWIDKVFGGFQFNSIINISSGVPLGVLDPSGTLNRQGRSGRQSAYSTLSKKELQKLIGEFRTPNGVFYINPSVLFALGSNGQRVDLTQELPAGVTITAIRGASPVDQAPFAGQVFFFNKVGQTGNLEKNLLNGPMYFNWDAGFSKNIRISEGMRLQLRSEFYNVLNNANFSVGDLTITNTTSFGRAGSAFSPRVIQFGARFDF